MKDDDLSIAATLTPKQKRIMRIGLTVYLIFMGTYTLLHNNFAPALFYAILTTLDYYLYTNVSDWVRIKRKR